MGVKDLNRGKARARNAIKSMVQTHNYVLEDLEADASYSWFYPPLSSGY